MKHTLRDFVTKQKTRVNIIHAPESSTIETRIFFKAGFLYFDSDTYHVPHMLEHLVLGHSMPFADDTILMRALETYGAVANASTSHEYIMVELRTPKQHFEKTFEMVLSNIYGTVIEQKALDIERDILLREIHERFDGAGAFLSGQVMTKFFEGVEPSNPEIHIDGINKLSVETIKNAYNAYIHPENMQVIVSGDISTAYETYIKKLLETICANASSSFTPPHIHSPEAMDDSISPLPFMEDTNGSFYLSTSAPVPKNLRQKVARDAAINLLFGTPTAIISTHLRGMGIVYSVDFDIIRLKDRDIPLVAIMADAPQLDKIIVEVGSKLHQYSSELPESDLARIKGYASSIVPTLLDTPAELVDWYKSSMLGLSPLVSIDEEMKAIASLTANDLASAIKELFITPEQMHLGLLSYDAHKWQAQAVELYKALLIEPRDGANAQKKITAVTEIREKKSSLPWWKIYDFIMYAVFISLVNIGNLPVKGQPNTTTFIDYVESTNNLGLALWVLAPLFVAGMLTFWNLRWFTRMRVVLLAFISSLGYWYAVARYFGDVGIDEQPWDQDMASIIQPAFFIITWLVLISSIRRLVVMRRNARLTPPEEL